MGFEKVRGLCFLPILSPFWRGFPGRKRKEKVLPLSLSLRWAVEVEDVIATLLFPFSL